MTAGNEQGHETSKRGWPLWEVFVRARRGLAHQHVGSLHAPDATMALRNARDVYTRRGEGVSIWVVPSVMLVELYPWVVSPPLPPLYPVGVTGYSPLASL